MLARQRTCQARGLRWLVPVVLGAGLALAAGCGGTAQGPGHSGDPAARPAPTPRVAPPIETDRGEIFNVTIYSMGAPVLVDKLEVEFNRRRGIHAFYGFYRDRYEELATIPFADIRRIEFVGPMPGALFDQAIIGRETMDLPRDAAFEVQITFRDNSRVEFFALVPKLRGERDFQLWELSLNAGAKQIDYIDFDR